MVPALLFAAALASSWLGRSSSRHSSGSHSRHSRHNEVDAYSTGPFSLHEQFEWYSGSGELPPGLPQERVPAEPRFKLASCPAPASEIGIGIAGTLEGCIGGNAGQMRSMCVSLEAAKKFEGVKIYEMSKRTSKLNASFDAFFTDCHSAPHIRRHDHTWLLLMKFFEAIEVLPRGDRHLQPYDSNALCSCGCGPERARIAPVAQNRLTQQAWERVGGASVNLRLHERPPKRPHTCRPRKLPPVGTPITVCYQGFQGHGYDLVPQAIPEFLARYKDVTVKLVTPAYPEWWQQAFDAWNYTERKVDMSRIKAVKPNQGGNNFGGMWKNLEDCDVGLVPQFSYHGKLFSKLIYPHAQAKRGQWNIEYVSSYRKIASHAGRGFMFTQLGIPVITDGDPESIRIVGRQRMGVVMETQLPGVWSWALDQVLTNYESMSRRSCEFERTELQPEVEAAKLVCWLRIWKEKLRQNPKLANGNYATKRRPGYAPRGAGSSRDSP
eukprot:Hpha_TRINITY_DN3875_c0_g1::TRINITY_DN3875_c0_g1_i1::g.44707::m.44707